MSTGSKYRGYPAEHERDYATVEYAYKTLYARFQSGERLSPDDLLHMEGALEAIDRHIDKNPSLSPIARALSRAIRLTEQVYHPVTRLPYEAEAYSSPGAGLLSTEVMSREELSWQREDPYAISEDIPQIRPPKRLRVTTTPSIPSRMVPEELAASGRVSRLRHVDPIPYATTSYAGPPLTRSQGEGRLYTPRRGHLSSGYEAEMIGQRAEWQTELLSGEEGLLTREAEGRRMTKFPLEVRRVAPRIAGVARGSYFLPPYGYTPEAYARLGTAFEPPISKTMRGTYSYRQLSLPLMPNRFAAEGFPTLGMQPSDPWYAPGGSGISSVRVKPPYGPSYTTRPLHSLDVYGMSRYDYRTEVRNLRDLQRASAEFKADFPTFESFRLSQGSPAPYSKEARRLYGIYMGSQGPTSQQATTHLRWLAQEWKDIQWQQGAQPDPRELAETVQMPSQARNPMHEQLLEWMWAGGHRYGPLPEEGGQPNLPYRIWDLATQAKENLGWKGSPAQIGTSLMHRIMEGNIGRETAGLLHAAGAMPGAYMMERGELPQTQAPAALMAALQNVWKYQPIRTPYETQRITPQFEYRGVRMAGAAAGLHRFATRSGYEFPVSYGNVPFYSGRVGLGDYPSPIITKALAEASGLAGGAIDPAFSGTISSIQDIEALYAQRGFPPAALGKLGYLSGIGQEQQKRLGRWDPATKRITFSPQFFETGAPHREYRALHELGHALSYGAQGVTPVLDLIEKQLASGGLRYQKQTAPAFADEESFADVFASLYTSGNIPKEVSYLDLARSPALGQVRAATSSALRPTLRQIKQLQQGPLGTRDLSEAEINRMLETAEMADIKTYSDPAYWKAHPHMSQERVDQLFRRRGTYQGASQGYGAQEFPEPMSAQIEMIDAGYGRERGGYGGWVAQDLGATPAAAGGAAGGGGPPGQAGIMMYGIGPEGQPEWEKFVPKANPKQAQARWNLVSAGMAGTLAPEDLFYAATRTGQWEHLRMGPRDLNQLWGLGPMQDYGFMQDLMPGISGALPAGLGGFVERMEPLYAGAEQMGARAGMARLQQSLGGISAKMPWSPLHREVSEATRQYNEMNKQLKPVTEAFQAIAPTLKRADEQLSIMEEGVRQARGSSAGWRKFLAQEAREAKFGALPLEGQKEIRTALEQAGRGEIDAEQVLGAIGTQRGVIQRALGMGKGLADIGGGGGGGGRRGFGFEMLYMPWWWNVAWRGFGGQQAEEMMAYGYRAAGAQAQLAALTGAEMPAAFMAGRERTMLAARWRETAGLSAQTGPLGTFQLGGMRAINQLAENPLAGMLLANAAPLGSMATMGFIVDMMTGGNIAGAIGGAVTGAGLGTSLAAAGAAGAPTAAMSLLAGGGLANWATRWAGLTPEQRGTAAFGGGRWAAETGGAWGGPAISGVTPATRTLLVDQMQVNEVTAKELQMAFGEVFGPATTPSTAAQYAAMWYQLAGGTTPGAQVPGLMERAATAWGYGGTPEQQQAFLSTGGTQAAEMLRWMGIRMGTEEAAQYMPWVLGQMGRGPLQFEEAQAAMRMITGPAQWAGLDQDQMIKVFGAAQARGITAGSLMRPTFEMQRFVQQTFGTTPYDWSAIGGFRPETGAVMTEMGAPIFQGEIRGTQAAMRGREFEQRRAEYQAAEAQALRQQTIVRQTWGLQDELTQMQIDRQRESFDLQVDQAENQLKWYWDSFNLYKEHWQETYALDKELFEARQRYWEEDFDTQRTQREQEHQWRMEDMAYQRDVFELRYQWQQEDFDRAIRFSTGRQKEDLMRQKERYTILSSMQRQQMEEQVAREEQRWQWTLDQEEREKQRHEEVIALQREQFDLRKQQFEEETLLREQMMADQQVFMERSLELLQARAVDFEREVVIQQQIRELQRTAQQEDWEYQKTKRDRDWEYYQQVFDWQGQIIAWQQQREDNEQMYNLTQTIGLDEAIAKGGIIAENALIRKKHIEDTIGPLDTIGQMYADWVDMAYNMSGQLQHHIGIFREISREMEHQGSLVGGVNLGNAYEGLKSPLTRQFGGPIAETGTYFLHEGEYVNQKGAQRSGPTYVIHIHGPTTTSMLDSLEAILQGHGIRPEDYFWGN